MKKQKQPETVMCPNCEGSGAIENPIWRGSVMRKLREAAGESQTNVARRLDLSKGYISDLELGRRAWSTDLIERYEKAVAA